jgi:hypothetical protein
MKMKIIAAIAACFAIGTAVASKVTRLNQGWYLAAYPTTKVNTATAVTACPDELTIACAYKFNEGLNYPVYILHRGSN